MLQEGKHEAVGSTRMNTDGVFGQGLRGSACCSSTRLLGEEGFFQGEERSNYEFSCSLGAMGKRDEEGSLRIDRLPKCLSDYPCFGESCLFVYTNQGVLTHPHYSCSWLLVLPFFQSHNLPAWFTGIHLYSTLLRYGRDQQRMSNGASYQLCCPRMEKSTSTTPPGFCDVVKASRGHSSRCCLRVC